jgi:hypothetical protein
MEVGSQEEFYVAISIYGGVILVGLLVTMVLIGLGISIRRNVKTGNEIKKLYEQERKNGQGGSRGKF